MWAFGCMIAALAFNKYPFFRAHGNINQLLSIVDILGTEGLQEYARKYNLVIPEEAEKQMGIKRKRDWSEFASNGVRRFICTELYDLLDNLLIYDHQVWIAFFSDWIEATECKGVYESPLFQYGKRRC